MSCVILRQPRRRASDTAAECRARRRRRSRNAPEGWRDGVPSAPAITGSILSLCSAPSRRGRHCASSGYTS